MRWMVFALLLLGACGDRNAKSWVGSSEGALYGAYGTPDRSQPITSGGKMVTFTGRNYLHQPVCESSFMISATGYVTTGRSSCM